MHIEGYYQRRIEIASCFLVKIEFEDKILATNIESSGFVRFSDYGVIIEAGPRPTEGRQSFGRVGPKVRQSFWRTHNPKAASAAGGKSCPRYEKAESKKIRPIFLPHPKMNPERL